MYNHLEMSNDFEIIDVTGDNGDYFDENEKLIDNPFITIWYSGELSQLARAIALTGMCPCTTQDTGGVCDKCFMTMYDDNNIDDFRLK